MFGNITALAPFAVDHRALSSPRAAPKHACARRATRRGRSRAAAASYICAAPPQTAPSARPACSLPIAMPRRPPVAVPAAAGAAAPAARPRRGRRAAAIFSTVRTEKALSYQNSHTDRRVYSARMQRCVSCCWQWTNTCAVSTCPKKCTICWVSRGVGGSWSLGRGWLLARRRRFGFPPHLRRRRRARECRSVCRASSATRRAVLAVVAIGLERRRRQLQQCRRRLQRL